MINRETGQYIATAASGKHFNAFIPHPLPPDPPLNMERIYPLLEKSSISLGRLDGLSNLLEDISIFLYMYIRKEAVLSSQIEGTQSSLSDLLIHENEGNPKVPLDDIAEVSSYVSAMNYALKRLETLPISLRLLKEIHKVLLNNSRGCNKQPGEFRRSQNWIGGSQPETAYFVPPPPNALMQCLDALEKFLHEDNKTPTLIKAALAHVQFETIHPFLDGNGRLGRLLIILMLRAEGVISKPLLYLSYYFKTNRQEYYDYLQSVRDTGNWESWVEFFLQGVKETADRSIHAITAIIDQFEKDKRLIEQSSNATAGVLKTFTHLQRNPITTPTKIIKLSVSSKTTTLRSLRTLEHLKIIKEITGKNRHKIFVYTKYLNILNDEISLEE